MNKKSVPFRLACVAIASFIMAMNINSFVNAAGLIPGGFNGISVFLQRVFVLYLEIEVPFSLINIALNAIPVYIGFKMIGKNFTIYSILTILLTGFLVDLLPIYAITEDILLICIFGGILNGVGILIALQGGASSGGTDFIAMAISKKTNEPSWHYVLYFNACAIIVAGFIFGWDIALYSIIFQYCNTQIVQTFHVKYKKITLFIITNKPEELMQAIMKETKHGVTCIEGYGGYSHKQKTMLYTVIGHAELGEVKRVVRAIDPCAFINVTKTDMIEGKFYQEPID